MTVEMRDLLLRQFRMAAGLFHHHCAQLSDEECFWRPARSGLHVHRDEQGVWVADWPEREDYDIGPPSIAWISWHIGFWWSMVINHSFGEGTLSRSDIRWPGTAAAVIAWIEKLEGGWLSAIEQLDDNDLSSTARTKWPFADRPFGDVIAWVTVELTKNAAEIGLVRFLYAIRKED